MSKRNAQNSKNTSKKQKGTRGNQPSTNQWYEIDYIVVDEVFIGDTKLRLVQNPNNKSKYIQLWSDLSKRWNITYRYDVDEQWNKWKKYADIHLTRYKNREAARLSVQLERTADDVGRTTKSKARTISTKNRVGCVRQPRRKSS